MLEGAAPRPPRRRAVHESLIALRLPAALAPAGAQAHEEEQTRDHEEQDRLYLDRNGDEPRAGCIARGLSGTGGRLIRDRNYRATRQRALPGSSDDPRLDTKAAAELLEFRDYFERFWRPLQLAAYDEQSRVYLFYSFHKFNQMLAGDFRYRSAPQGALRRLIDVITLHTDAGGPDGLANALVHEAAHQLIDQRLFGVEQVRPAPWISEGLASYFGLPCRIPPAAFSPARSAASAHSCGRMSQPWLQRDQGGDPGGQEGIQGIETGGESPVEEMVLMAVRPRFTAPGSEGTTPSAGSWSITCSMERPESMRRPS